MDKRGKLDQVFHDWYTDRWNDLYSKAREPGWAISDDISRLLLDVAPKVTPQQLKAALRRISKQTVKE